MSTRPEIVVTTSTDHLGQPSTTQPTSNFTQGHNRRPSDPTLLGPSDDGHDLNAPASPTQSTLSSVHNEPSSLQLRENQPTHKSGAGSLAMLSPSDNTGHGRKNSTATNRSDDGTVADHENISLAPLKSHNSDKASTLRDATSTPKPSKKASGDSPPIKEGEEGDERPALNPGEDVAVDLGPFKFGLVVLLSHAYIIS
jgi:hypothetical protein